MYNRFKRVSSINPSCNTKICEIVQRYNKLKGVTEDQDHKKWIQTSNIVQSLSANFTEDSEKLLNNIINFQQRYNDFSNPQYRIVSKYYMSDIVEPLDNETLLLKPEMIDMLCEDFINYNFSYEKYHGNQESKYEKFRLGSIIILSSELFYCNAIYIGFGLYLTSNNKSQYNISTLKYLIEDPSGVSIQSSSSDIDITVQNVKLFYNKIKDKLEQSQLNTPNGRFTLLLTHVYSGESYTDIFKFIFKYMFNIYQYDNLFIKVKMILLSFDGVTFDIDNFIIDTDVFPNFDIFKETVINKIEEVFLSTKYHSYSIDSENSNNTLVSSNTLSNISSSILLEKTCLDAIKESIGVKDQCYLKTVSESGVFNGIRSIVFKAIGNIVIDKVIIILKKLQNLFIDIKREVFSQIIKAANFINIPFVTKFATDSLLYGTKIIKNLLNTQLGSNIESISYLSQIQFDNIKSTAKSVLEISDGLINLAFKNPITILESVINLNSKLTDTQIKEIDSFGIPISKIKGTLEYIGLTQNSKFSGLTLLGLKTIISFKSDNYSNLGINTLIQFDELARSCNTVNLIKAINKDNIKNYLYLNESELNSYVKEYGGHLGLLCKWMETFNIQEKWMSFRDKIPYIDALLGPSIKFSMDSIKSDKYYNPEISYFINENRCKETASRIIETKKCTVKDIEINVDLDTAILSKQYFYKDLSGVEHITPLIQKNGLISFLTEHINKDFPLDIQTYNIEPFHNYMRDIFYSYDMLMLCKNILSLANITDQSPMSMINKPSINSLQHLPISDEIYSLYYNYVFHVCIKDQIIDYNNVYTPKIYNTSLIFTETEQATGDVYNIIILFLGFLKSKKLSIDHMSFIYVYYANIFGILYNLGVKNISGYFNKIYDNIKTIRNSNPKSLLTTKLKELIDTYQTQIGSNDKLREYFLNSQHNLPKIVDWIADNLYLCLDASKNNNNILTNVFQNIKDFIKSLNIRNISSKLDTLTSEFIKSYSDSTNYIKYKVTNNIVLEFNTRMQHISQDYKDDFIKKELIFNGSYLNLIPYYLQNQNKDLLLNKLTKWIDTVNSETINKTPYLSSLLFNFSKKDLWFYPKYIKNENYTILLVCDGININIIINSKMSNNDTTLLEFIGEQIIETFFSSKDKAFEVNDPNNTEEIRDKITKYAKNYIKLNYPNISKYIIDPYLFLKNNKKIKDIGSKIKQNAGLSLTTFNSYILPILNTFLLLSASGITNVKDKITTFFEKDPKSFEEFKNTSQGSKFIRSISDTTNIQPEKVSELVAEIFESKINEQITSNKSPNIDSIKKELSNNLPPDIISSIDATDYDKYIDDFRSNQQNISYAILAYYLEIAIPDNFIEKLKNIGELSKIQKSLTGIINICDTIDKLNTSIDLYNNINNSTTIDKRSLYNPNEIQNFIIDYTEYLTNNKIPQEAYPEFFKNIQNYNTTNEFNLIYYTEKPIRIKNINIIAEGPTSMLARNLRSNMITSFPVLKKIEFRLTLFNNSIYSINKDDNVKSVYFSGHPEFYMSHGVSFGPLGSYEFIHDIQPNTVLLDETGHIKVFTSKQKIIPNQLISIRTGKSNLNDFFKGLWEIYSLISNRTYFLKRIYFMSYSNEGIMRQQNIVSKTIIKFARRLSKYIRYFLPVLKDFTKLKDKIKYDNKVIDYIQNVQKSDLYSLKYPLNVESININTIDDAINFLLQNTTDESTESANLSIYCLNCSIDCLLDNEEDIILKIFNKFYCMYNYYILDRKIDISQLITTTSFMIQLDINNFFIKNFKQDVYTSILNNTIIGDIPTILKHPISQSKNLSENDIYYIKEYNTAKALNNYLIQKTDTIENFNNVKDALVQYRYADDVLLSYINYLKHKNPNLYSELTKDGINIDTLILNFHNYVKKLYYNLNNRNNIVIQNLDFNLRLHYALFHQDYSVLYSKYITGVMPDVVENSIFYDFSEYMKTIKKYDVVDSLKNILLYNSLNKIFKFNNPKIIIHGKTNEDILLNLTETKEFIKNGKLQKIITLKDNNIQKLSLLCLSEIQSYKHIANKIISTVELQKIIKDLPPPQNKINYNMPITQPPKF